MNQPDGSITWAAVAVSPMVQRKQSHGRCRMSDDTLIVHVAQTTHFEAQKQMNYTNHCNGYKSASSELLE
jgi:hypothetical protein